MIPISFATAIILGKFNSPNVIPIGNVVTWAGISTGCYIGVDKMIKVVKAYKEILPVVNAEGVR